MRRIALGLLFASVAACGVPQPTMEPIGGEVAKEPEPPPAAPVQPAAPPPAPKAQTLALPEGSGIDESNLDRGADPCQDFYQFACGGWIKKTEIPGDRSRWGSFSAIDERNLAVSRQLLEGFAAGKGDKNNDAYADKLGSFYAACMDEAKIEKTAQKDLKDQLAKVAAVKNPAQMVKLVAQLHLGLSNVFFNFGSQQDFKDATQVIAGADQGGIGMPDRDYYLKDDERSKGLRAKYQEHVAKMLELAGAPAKQAATDAATVMRLETALAQASLTRVERRDPAKIYHRINLDGLTKAAPKFLWKDYLKELGHPNITEINVTHPEFFTAMSGLMEKEKIEDLKTYVRWHVVHSAAPFLSKNYVDEHFRFYGMTLSGTKELPQRWKRCVNATDRMMGEALGQAFVKQTFGSDGKERALEIVHAIEAAMEEDIKSLSWMDDATRAQAMDKLKNIANKIGYPDKWRNYDKLNVTRDSYLKNMMAGSTFESHRDLDKISKPLDRGEWIIPPQTVNAYYEPSLNEMVFPAGILQPPFFNREAKRSVNYGAIGMVMGHELTHGFDDEGRQFDAKGNLREWWSPPVGKEFDRRAECVVEQFNGYSVGDLKLNGKLVLGENIADLGGLKLAYAAMTKAADKLEKRGQDQFSDAQLFWLGTAQAWCAKTREEEARMRVTTDPHSPPEYRINGPLSNLREFADAFQCKAGDTMVRQNQCVIW